MDKKIYFAKLPVTIICFDPKFYHISKNILIYTDLTDILSYFKRNFDKYRRYDELPRHHAFPLCEQ